MKQGITTQKTNINTFTTMTISESTEKCLKIHDGLKRDDSMRSGKYYTVKNLIINFLLDVVLLGGSMTDM
jgi:hypothetical protein